MPNEWKYLSSLLSPVVVHRNTIGNLSRVEAKNKPLALLNNHKKSQKVPHYGDRGGCT